MNYSNFGQKFSGKSGIVELMDDLGSALNENPDMLFMGGGNPGRVPEVEAYFEKQLISIAQDPIARHNLLGIYQSPQGEKGFREQLANYLAKAFNWNISDKNIAVSNGSQSAFFIIYNMLAGIMENGDKKTIHFPLAPEYVGYADAGLSDEFFSSTKPSIEIIDNETFKYHVDFSTLNIDNSIAALSVSRPTNPTGNVITDEEIVHLDKIAKQANIPLIIDGAYGLPFPNILFTDAKPHWNENTIVVLSLSKMGLPGIRTGIVIANEQFIKDFTNANIITNLACGNLGPALSKDLFSKNDIQTLTDKITPFYQQKAEKTVELLKQNLAGIPFKIHKPEGAIFLWLWLEGLPISSKELYQRLKAKGVLIIPGEDFFIGIDDNWQHKYECIRLSYAQDESVVEQAVKIIADEIKGLYVI
ncbi:valine--pyruvate transaminase [Colwellia sp. UCD-KL20]|uniref:valine--pyruvate transaminase n=1 Tax=Colwellia sp. UCD-KL20 TaxID=1917165 RepID=UPI000970A24C|nr:valine--pyruvate transaminase [Colwellia sp. UCD-KL20]